MTEQQRFTIPIDGRLYGLDDLSFRERKELRQLVRESLGRDDAELSDVVDDVDLVPQMVFLIRRRSDASYTLERAMELSLAELEGEREAAGGPPEEAAEAA